MMILETHPLPEHLKTNLKNAIRNAAAFSGGLFTENRFLFTGEVALQMARDLCLYLDGTFPRENLVSVLARHNVKLSENQTAALSLLQKESRKEEDYNACMAQINPAIIKSLIETLAASI